MSEFVLSPAKRYSNKIRRQFLRKMDKNAFE